MIHNNTKQPLPGCHLAALRWVPALLLLAAAATAQAAPEEIQVYMDEMNKPGEYGLDLHNNDVLSGNATPDYPGGQAAAHVYRLTPEFSYGLTPSLELGAYVLSSAGPGGASGIDGEKLRLKYIAPKAGGQAYFWGANLEVGRVAHRVDINPWNAELKGIFGYRSGRWTFATNTNFDWALSGPQTGPATLQLASKVAYQTQHHYQVGIESYNDLGPVSRMGRLNDQSQVVYGVVDTTIHGWDLNFGLGRGLTPVSDRWVAKAIVGVPFK